MCQLGALRASLVPWDHRCVIFRKHLKWPDGRNTLGPICTLSGGSHTWSDHVRPCEIPVTERLLGPRCVTRVSQGLAVRPAAVAATTAATTGTERSGSGRCTRMTPSVSPRNTWVRGDSSPSARARPDRWRQQLPVDFVEFGTNGHGRHDRHGIAYDLCPRARQGAERRDRSPPAAL